MCVKSELHLVVPGLNGPLADIGSLRTNAGFQTWLKVLSRAKSLSRPGNTHDVLSTLFALNIENDFPSAALTLLAADMYDDSRYYMHADPVHMQADMDHAILTSSADMDITDSESSALCKALNQHFKQDGLAFFALNSKQWFVLSNDEIALDTTALVDAVGRNVNFILPAGKNASRWRQLLTEAQMLLYSHDVNTGRENSGQQSINSLWFHGSGQLPGFDENDACYGKVNSVCGDSGVVKGMARLSGCEYAPLPVAATEYIDRLLVPALTSEQHFCNILYLDELEHLVNYTDVSMWLEKLDEMVSAWLHPLLKVSQQKNIQVILHDCNKKQYHFSKYDALCFWRSAGHGTRVERYVDSY